jgi:hypothetical protein
MQWRTIVFQRTYSLSYANCQQRQILSAANLLWSTAAPFQRTTSSSLSALSLGVVRYVKQRSLRSAGYALGHHQISQFPDHPAQPPERSSPAK